MQEMMTQVKSQDIIMVESSPHAQGNPASHQAETCGGKKKNKKKKAKSESTESVSVSKQRQNQEGIVTLKNPMFQNPNQDTIPRNMHTPTFMSPMPVESHGASITRNENGMYTIRNPSFQSAFGGETPSPVFIPRPQTQQDARTNQASHFSAKNEEQPMDQQPKCSVIGSEMKTALKRRQEQEFNSVMEDEYNQYGMQKSLSTYSHFGGSGVNFCNNGTQCEDNFQSYPTISYDDLRLQPGQMLNPEVS